jgi:hypothetical protein
MTAIGAKADLREEMENFRFGSILPVHSGAGNDRYLRIAVVLGSMGDPAKTARIEETCQVNSLLLCELLLVLPSLLGLPAPTMTDPGGGGQTRFANINRADAVGQQMRAVRALMPRSSSRSVPFHDGTVSSCLNP